MNKLVLHDELENKLIHFQFAKKGKKGVNGNTNVDHSNVEYIKSFDLENIGIKELYSELCEVALPAANSVNCFTKEKIVSEHHFYIVTSTETDNGVIAEIMSKYLKQIENLLRVGISLSCICLKIFTLFDFENIHSEYINKSMFETILNKEAWEMRCWK